MSTTAFVARARWSEIPFETTEFKFTSLNDTPIQVVDVKLENGVLTTSKVPVVTLDPNSKIHLFGNIFHDDTDEIIAPRVLESNELVGSGEFGEVYAIRGDKYVFKRRKPVEFDINSVFPDEEGFDQLIFESGLDGQSAEVKSFENFKNEVEILKKLRGKPHVVEICGYTEDYNYIILPRFKCCLGALETLMSPDTQNLIECQLAHGLKEIWNMNCVHGNINPHNILIDTEGHAAIGGFGQASSWEKPKKVGASMLSYFAPEMLKGDKIPTKAEDIWALGCVMIQVRKRALKTSPFACGEWITQKPNNKLMRVFEDVPLSDDQQLYLINEMLDDKDAPEVKCSKLVVDNWMQGDTGKIVKGLLTKFRGENPWYSFRTNPITRISDFEKKWPPSMFSQT